MHPTLVTVEHRLATDPTVAVPPSGPAVGTARKDTFTASSTVACARRRSERVGVG